jgi:GNAT superfamily N-acetyltransferase
VNTPFHDTKPTRFSSSLADEHDHQITYGIRYEVYARELGQHAENSQGRLMDKLDTINVYIVAKVGEEIAGFVSVTPPNEVGYSIDKYFTREELPFRSDQDLYETRILTVSKSWRNRRVAALLMYAALRYIQSVGGKTVVGIGRLAMYKHAGFRCLQRQISAGEVTFELIVADVEQGRSQFMPLIPGLEEHADWNLDGVSFHKTDLVYHGGAFFEAVGEEFDCLERKEDVISADVLDAWFDPAPRVINALREHLPWALRTSPPTGCEGMQHGIARSGSVAKLGESIKDQSEDANARMFDDIIGTCYNKMYHPTH